METKTANVLEHLKSKGSITSWEAIQLYGATRLSAIIFKLRHQGFKIINEWQQEKDRNNQTVRYVKYVLEVENNG